MDECGQCKAVAQWEAGETNDMVVARTSTGFVTLLSTQYYPGHTVFVSRQHGPEVFDLGDKQEAHLREMGGVAEAVCRAFKPRKLNTAALGNQSPHLHWSLIPRYEDDPQPLKSPWEDAAFWEALYSGVREPREVEAERFNRLLEELHAVGVPLEQEWAP